MSSERTHTGHFYGGPHDGEVHEMNQFAASWNFPDGRYLHVASAGAETHADCRDHIYRHLPPLEPPAADFDKRPSGRSWLG